jgi:hypothetical protein
MTLDSLDALKDEELQAVVDRSQLLLKDRDRTRKDKAVEDARAILSAAGLSLKDVAAKGGRNGNAKAPVYRGGRHYQHPAMKELVWNAKGQKPNWLRELEREGRRAVEIPAEASGESAKSPQPESAPSKASPQATAIKER